MALSCSKKLSTLLWGQELSCLHSFKTKNKLKSHEKVCVNKDFWGIVMPSEKADILKFNQYLKSYKMAYIIYADVECLVKKIRWMRK